MSHLCRFFSAYFDASALTSTSGTKELKLNNAGAGGFVAGNITDGNGQIAVTKSGSGIWALSGTNTYSGNTTILNTGGTIRILGKDALSPNTKLVMERTTTLSLRMDESGSVNLGNELELSASDTSTNITTTYTIDVRNNGGATTGSTLVLGKLDFAGNSGNNASGRRIVTTGDNGYRVQFGDVDLHHAITGTATGGPHRFEPSSAPITIAGTIRQISGNTGSSATDNNLYLGGSAAGNLVSGTIEDALDYPSNPNATPLNITKGEASDWTLTGANTYTGTTTISGGTLEIGGSGLLGGGSYNGNISIASTNSGTFRYNSTAVQTLGGEISGAGALVKDNSGVLTLSGTNTYTGATTVTGGTLVINGSTSTSSVVSVGASGTLGGDGVVGGATTIAGKLQPGNSPGILEFTSSLALEAAAETTMEILGLTRDSQYDGVDVGGALTYDGSLIVNFGTTFGGGSYTFNLFDFASESGDFDTVSLSGLYTGSLVFDAVDEWGLVDGDNTWTFTQSTGELALTVIPEPSSALLVGLSSLLLFRRRR